MREHLLLPADAGRADAALPDASIAAPVIDAAPATAADAGVATPGPERTPARGGCSISRREAQRARLAGGSGCRCCSRFAPEPAPASLVTPTDSATPARSRERECEREAEN